MNERIKELALQADKLSLQYANKNNINFVDAFNIVFAELIVADMHRKVIASILITDVVMEEKGLTPTSEDYIRAINKDFGVEE